MLGPAVMVEHYLIVSCGLSPGVDVVNALQEKDTKRGILTSRNELFLIYGCLNLCNRNALPEPRFITELRFKIVDNARNL